MNEFKFKALGTEWGVTLDGGAFPEETKNKVLDYVNNFEKRFSRFLPDSEVNAFRNTAAGKFKVSKELTVLLKEAARLRELTGGAYDPAVGGLLERVGYDASYRMEPSENVGEFVLPKWDVIYGEITIDGPTAFDLGGMGKGYCIDGVADLLKNLDHRYFIVDGGGDMYATKKNDGSSWRVAIQYPGKPDMAAGVVELRNEGLAVSDSFRRRWGKWHHLVNPHLKKSVEGVIGAAAVAGRAWYADCMTSALFLSSEDKYQNAAREYEAGYMVFKNNGTSIVSNNWKGEIF